MTEKSSITHSALAKECLPPSSPHEFHHFTSSSLPPDLLLSCFNLIEQTSSAAYEASSKGWSSEGKKAEMRDKDMQYLLLFSKAVSQGEEASRSPSAPAEEKPLGFLSYMLTIDDSIPVIYIYEVHFQPTAQGQGLGKVLMACVDAIGRHESMKKAMLTVFVSNARAIEFYERLGYEKWDEEYIPRTKKRLRSRVVEPERKPSYIIMAKELESDGWETDGSDGSSQADK